MAPRPFPCSAKPSATTCAARPSASPTGTRSSSAIRATAHLSPALGRHRGNRPRAAGARRREGGPRRRLVAESLRVGRPAIRHGPHRRHPRQHQPGLQGDRAGVCPEPIGQQRAAAGPPVSPVRLPGDARTKCAAAARSCARRSCWRTTGTSCVEAATRSVRGRAGRARGHAAVRRADQHPVHLRHHGLPEGRDAVAPQHLEQRLLHRLAAGLHRERPRLHSRAVLSLLRHGAGQPGLHADRAPAWSCPANRSIRWPCWKPCRRRRCTSLYGVPTMFIAELDHPRFARVRSVAACGPASWPARRAPSS